MTDGTGEGEEGEEGEEGGEGEEGEEEGKGRERKGRKKRREGRDRGEIWKGEIGSRRGMTMIGRCLKAEDLDSHGGLSGAIMSRSRLFTHIVQDQPNYLMFSL
eukprot:761903-Hanusia_phi.AAC.2